MLAYIFLQPHSFLHFEKGCGQDPLLKRTAGGMKVTWFDQYL